MKNEKKTKFSHKNRRQGRNPNCQKSKQERYPVHSKFILNLAWKDVLRQVKIISSNQRKICPCASIGTGRFTPGEKAHRTHWIEGWVSPIAGLDTVDCFQISK
jgi:hypothetical protein